MMSNVAADIQELEQRITKGEAYLAEHPNEQRAIDRYLELCYRYGILIEEGETIVTLDLPEGVAWSRTKDDPPNRRVRIILVGFPREADELSLDDLAALNQTMRTKEEASE